MNDAATEILDRALEEAQALRDLLDPQKVSANLQACQDDLVDPAREAALESAESAHDTCRQAETEVYVAYLTEKLAYEAAINSSQPPNCTQNWISACTDPASTFYSIENSNERKTLS